MKFPAHIFLVLFFLAAVHLGTAEAAETKTLRVKRIDFQGNRAFNEKKLRSLMGLNAAGFLRSAPYNPRTLVTDLDRVRNFYVDQGYLDAVIQKTDIDSTGNKVKISITVSEGERTLVQDVVVSGNTAFTAQQILKVIPIKPQKPFRGSQIQESVNAIMNLYGRKGYIMAAVDPDIRVNHDIDRAIVNFILIEGVQCHITDIDIQGLRKTRSHVVRRELPFKQGDVIDVARIYRSENNLYTTGIFNSVLIQPLPAPGDSTGRIMQVTLRERKSGEFDVGLGYETVSGFGGTLAVRNNNFAGTGMRIGFNSEINQKNQIYQASYANSWTFDRRLRSNVTSVLEYNQEEPGFDYRRIGGSYVLGKRFRRHMDASIQLSLEGIRNYNIRSASVTSTSEKGNLRSLIPALTYDSRNDYFNTRKGSYIEIRNGLVGAVLGGTVSYNNLSLIARRYFPATPSLTIASSVQFDLQNLLGNTLVVPLSERLYVGGPNTLRGYGYQKVGPKDSEGIPLGGRLLLTGNLEMRLHVYKLFGVAAFFDAGNVWATPGDFDIASLRSDAGLGARLNTPVGTIRIDYAYKIHRRSGEGLTQFYVAFGQPF